MDIEVLEREALKLSADERARLARELLTVSMRRRRRKSTDCGSKRRVGALHRSTPARLSLSLAKKSTERRKHYRDEVSFPPGGGSRASRAGRLLRVMPTRARIALSHAFPPNDP